MRAPRHFRRAGRRMEGAAGLWALGVLLGLLVVVGGSAAEGSDLPERCLPPTFGIGLTVRTETVNFFGSESDERHGPSTFRFFPGDEIRVRLRLENGDGLAPPRDSGFEEILARADLCLVRGHEGPPLLMFVEGGALDQFLARSAALREAWFAEHFVPSDSVVEPVQRPCRDRGCWGWVDVLVSLPDDLPPGDYTLWAFLADPALDPYRRVCERGAELSNVLFMVTGPARNEGEQLYGLYRDAVVAYSDRDLAKAEEKARALLALDPLSAHENILLGNACFDAGKLSEALIRYRRAVEVIESESDTKLLRSMWPNLRDDLVWLRGRIEMIVGSGRW